MIKKSAQRNRGDFLMLNDFERGTFRIVACKSTLILDTTEVRHETLLFLI
jgi:hypothetical protein